MLALVLLAALPALAGVAGGGARPSFAPRQPTALVAPLGHAATLHCIVYNLLDKSVSWVRSSDLQILTHAGAVFTADARVSAAVAALGAGASRHSLTVERLRSSDAGRYECQLNTEPKMSLFFNLSVADEPVPRVLVRALEGGAARGAAGGAASLACEARLEPPRDPHAAPLHVRWLRHGAPLDAQSDRGGVSLDTSRWATRAVSRLTLAALGAADAGAYRCELAPGGVGADLTLTVDPPEAMQRDAAAPPRAAAPAPRPALAAVTSLAALLLARR